MAMPGANGDNGDRSQASSLDVATGRFQTAGESATTFLLYLLRIFTTRLWVFLIVVALVMGLMAYVTLRSEPVYQAAGVILVERQSQNLRTFEDPLMVNTDEVDYFNTQVKIIQGPGMAARVAKRLRLAERPGFGPEAAEALLGSLSVVLARNNRIFEIYFEHRNRDFAAEVVNAFIDEYQLDTAERRRSSIDALYNEMTHALEDVKRDLDASEQDLLAFYNEKGLLLGEEKVSVQRQLMEQAGRQLLREEEELARLEAIAAEVEKAGKDMTRMRGVALAHNMLGANDTLQMELTRALQEQAELGKRVTPTHPSYLAAVAAVDEVRRKMEEQALQFSQGIQIQREAGRRSVKSARTLFDEYYRKSLEQDKLLADAEIRRRNRDANRALFDALNLRAKESQISSGLPLTNIQVLRRADPPSRPVRPTWAFNMALGLIAALISGAAAIVLLDRIDNTVRTTEDVEAAYDLPVLSVIPLTKDDQLSSPAAIACWKEEHSQLAEAFRRVRAATLLSVRGPQGGPIRQILVASPGPDEGKTITSTNLAISLAQMGERTLLIDADFYRSETHKLFSLDREKGLSTVLVSDIALPQVVQPTSVPFLDYLATGMIPPQPATLLGSARMTWVLQEAVRAYSRVVIDTAPLVAVTDASLLAPHADATILVVRDGKTSKTALHRSLQTLGRIGVRPLGFVFNGVRTGVGEFYFRYHHPSYSMEPEVRQHAGPS